MDPDVESVIVGWLREPYHFDSVSEFSSESNVEIGNTGDTLTVDLACFNRSVEGECGKDGDLVGDVITLDIVSGVGFGIARRLCLAQGRAKGELFPLHPGKDVVGGSIDDTGEPDDPVAEKSALKRRYEGNTAGDCRLEENNHSVLTGEVEDLGAVSGNEGFVGSDDVFTVPYRRRYQLVGRCQATGDLDNYTDSGVVDQFKGIACQLDSGQVDRTMAIEITDGNPSKPETWISTQEVDDSGSYRTQSHHTNIYCGINFGCHNSL